MSLLVNGTILISAAIMYCWIVKTLRYNRMNSMPNLNNYSGQKRLEMAFRINNQLSYSEFPFLSTTSLQLGLFKTYAIPSISKILAGTKEFELYPGKRYDDTDLLLQELVSCPSFAIPNEGSMSRSEIALKRLNHIHSIYPINNGDMIYTLCVFILEPIRWIQKYGWRSMTENEAMAIFETWRHVGIQMGIKDIPLGMKELCRFYEEYEQEHIEFNTKNAIVAQHTMTLFLTNVPFFARPLVQHVLEALLSPKVNDAFGFDPPNTKTKWVLDLIFRFRKFLVRNFFFPRFLGKETYS
jgi:hypothetical protein